MKEKELRQSVCLVLMDANYKCLMVTRSDGFGIGLPGGKVDFGETVAQAARRELWEETGIYADYHNFIEVYSGLCEDSRSDKEAFFVTTYLVAKWTGEAVLKEPNVLPLWRPLDDLVTNSPFKEYHVNMLEHLVKKFPYFKRHTSVAQTPIEPLQTSLDVPRLSL